MKCIPGNSQHMGSRREQQDSFGFSDPDDLELVAHGGFLAVLADGAGGMQEGATASHIAVKVFLDAYREKTAPEAIPAALRRCLDKANAGVCAIAIEANAVENVATTLVAAVIHHDRLYWISVGDSALYLYRQGCLSLLTQSHTYGQALDREASLGRISTARALADPDRDALTSYVGMRFLNDIDEPSEPLPLFAGDKILLSSDGLFKTLTVAEIGAELGLNAQAACESLIDKTLGKNRRYQDNVTVLCIEIEANQENSTTVRLPIASRAADRQSHFWEKFFQSVRRQNDT